MVYNRKKLGTLDSYAILFDEKYKGQISIKDDPGVMIPITALYMGYTNPWRLETGDLKKITDFLIAKKPMFRKLWGGFAEAVFAAEKRGSRGRRRRLDFHGLDPERRRDRHRFRHLQSEERRWSGPTTG